MARYISKYTSFKKTVMKEQSTLVHGPNGPTITVTREPLIAIFQQAGATPWEREMALARFGFHGTGEGEDPVRRISAFDTEAFARDKGLNDAEREEIERLLDQQQSADYFRVEMPKIPAPWPAYDELVPQGRRSAEHVAEQIAETVRSLGLNPDAVIAYERQERNRAEVIAALQAPVEAEDGELVVEA